MRITTPTAITKNTAEPTISNVVNKDHSVLIKSNEKKKKD
jgi:hypothetical protein